MSSLVYPANLPGLTFGSTRSPVFNTGLQQALSAKESAIAYQQYPVMEWELQYEFLRDDVTPSQLQAIVGLFMAMGGKYDSFLYSDPVFNTVTNMQFGVTNGVATIFQTTATYQNVGGPGGAELIQNFNGTPLYYLNRFGPLQELLYQGRTNYALHSQDFTVAPWGVSAVTMSLSGTAPDGTATSDVMTETGSAVAQHYVGQSITVPSTALVWTFSGFVKPSARGWVVIELIEATGSTVVNVWFNLTTGAVGTIQTGANWSSVSGTINPAGNGWFRVSVTAIKTNAATVINAYFMAATADASLTYAGAASTLALYLWGAQFEQTNGSTFYVPTTTAAVAQTDYTLSATGIVTLTGAIAALVGAILDWTGSFFYRCRFDDDSFTSTQFMNKLWENKKVKLRQRKL